MPTDIPLIVVVADRGAGKTTLLRRWRDELDRAGRFESIWIQAAETATADDPLAPWAELLRTATRPHCVFIDDFHRIPGPGNADRLLGLVGRTEHRFVLASQRGPDLELHRWRATGLMAEIGSTDLRLGLGAIIGLAAERGVTVEAPVLDRILDLTEGWAEGVVRMLARLAAEPAAPQAEVVESVAVECADDLAAEIEREVTPTDYDFLVVASILDRIDGELGSAVAEPAAGGSGRPVVDLPGLVRQVPFTETVDGTGRTIQVHRLARMGLRRRLAERESKGETAARHLAAARSLELTGRLRDAVDHYLAAGEPERAADALGAAWSRDPSQVHDDEIDRVTAAGAADYVPHMMTMAEGHVRAGKLELAGLISDRLADRDWDGPLPHGYANLASAVTELRSNRRDVTIEHMERFVAALGSRELGYLDSRDLVSRYTAAHYCYLLDRIDEARSRVEQVVSGHRSVGRELLADQLVTVLACDLLALLDHDVGNLDQAGRHQARADELLQEYGIDDLGDVSKQALQVHVLALAVAGPDDLDRRLVLLDRLAREAPALNIRLHAAIESVRLLDRAARFEEALDALDRLEVSLAGRKPPPLLAARLTMLQEAVRPRQTVTAPALHITSGERAVLYLLADEALSQTDIGDRLGLSINTVKSHLRSIYQKLGVTSRAEAVDVADQRRMLVTVRPWLKP